VSRSIPPTPVSRAERTRLAYWRRRTLVALRVLFALFWAVSAWFTSQSGTVAVLERSLIHVAQDRSLTGQPWLSFWLHLVTVNPVAFASGIAFLEGSVALGLFCGVLTNLTCGLGIALSLLSWSTRSLALIAPVGLNLLAGDPGIFLIAILACIGLSLSGAGQFSGLDRQLSTRLGYWSFLASSGSQTPAHIPAQSVAWEMTGLDREHPVEYPVFPVGRRIDGISRSKSEHRTSRRQQSIVREQVLSSRKRA
jgi:thiosulfate dehydrogenase [quinone] large subunit